MGSGPLRILANPQLSMDLVCLYQPPFEFGYLCYSPQYDELLRVYIGLKSQYFPLTLFTKGFRLHHMQWTLTYPLINSKINWGLKR